MSELIAMDRMPVDVPPACRYPRRPGSGRSLTEGCEGAAQARTSIGILSVSDTPLDHAELRQHISTISCQFATAYTCRHALELLMPGGVSIVVCEQELPDGTWRDILKYIETSRQRTLLIVASRLADGYLWAEVLHLGGFDVLAKPFNVAEVRHVLETASLHMRLEERKPCTNPIASCGQRS